MNIQTVSHSDGPTRAYAGEVPGGLIFAIACVLNVLVESRYVLLTERYRAVESSAFDPTLKPDGTICLGDCCGWPVAGGSVWHF